MGKRIPRKVKASRINTTLNTAQYDMDLFGRHYVTKWIGGAKIPLSVAFASMHRYKATCGWVFKDTKDTKLGL